MMMSRVRLRASVVSPRVLFMSCCVVGVERTPAVSWCRVVAYSIGHGVVCCVGLFVGLFLCHAACCSCVSVQVRLCLVFAPQSRVCCPFHCPFRLPQRCCAPCWLACALDPWHTRRPSLCCPYCVHPSRRLMVGAAPGVFVCGGCVPGVWFERPHELTPQPAACYHAGSTPLRTDLRQGAVAARVTDAEAEQAATLAANLALLAIHDCASEALDVSVRVAFVGGGGGGGRCRCSLAHM